MAKSMFTKKIDSECKINSDPYREDSFIDFVRKNVPCTFTNGEVGILVVDISVEIGIIGFPQARIKRNYE